MADLDYIIVGQGIAGSCLALELLERGKRVAIFDNDWRNAACLVAAGVVNPITGQRLVKSWRSDVAHPYAKTFYKNLENRLDAEFFHNRKILQLCKSLEENQLWVSRENQDGYREFIGDYNNPNTFENLNDTNGSHFIEHSAWIETESAMNAFKKYFKKLNILHSDEFDFSMLKIDTDSIKYKSFDSEKIVFCDGWRAIENPYFSWLPYRPAKGEILTLESSTDIPNHIIHRGNWIMKCGQNRFRLGSTWDRKNFNNNPTDSALVELSKAVPSMFKEKIEFKVVAHQAGVRPCTATTRPHIGEYPDDARILSFNGFGSKGYSLSPYFAKHFCDWQAGECQLDKEANLQRHIKKFWKK